MAESKRVFQAAIEKLNVYAPPQFLKFFSTCFSIVFLINVGSTQASEDLADASDFFNLELFSLSKLTERAFDAPAAVYVLSAEDIRRLGVNNIADALRFVPGMNVAQQQGHKWAVSARGFNSWFANKLLVLMDGRTVYKELFSGTFWDTVDVPIELIDRIEVIRGPGGSIWGSNAVNGVVNIITKDTKATQGSHISMEASLSGDAISSVVHGAEIGVNQHLRIHAQYTGQGDKYWASGGNANDGYHNAQMGFRYDWNDDTSHEKVSIYGNILLNESQNFFSTVPTLTPPFNTPLHEDKYSENAYLMAHWEHMLSDSSQLNTKVIFDYDKIEIGSFVDWQAYVFELDIHNINQLKNNYQFIWGLGFRHVADSHAAAAQNPWIQYRNPHRDDSVFSSFLQLRKGVIPDKLYVTLGSKFEHNDYSGFEYQPSIRISAYPSDTQTLWASVSRAVRVASRGETDATIRLAGTENGYIARKHGSGFNAEVLHAYELGYRFWPVDWLSVDISSFYNSYKELRTLEPNAPFSDVIVPYEVSGEGYGETYGMELSARAQVKPNWKLHLIYSFLQIELHKTSLSNDPSFELIEGQSPQHQFTIQSLYNISPTIELDSVLYFVGELDTVYPSPVPSYMDADIRLGWHFRPGMELSILARSLFDNRRTEFEPALYSREVEIGRNIHARLSMRF